MYKIAKQIEFDAAHRLLDYEGPCAVLHGHRYKVEMIFESNSLTRSGFVVDFSYIKKVVKPWIDEHWDHGTLLNEKDALVSVLRTWGQKVYVMDCNPTAENIAETLYRVFKDQLPYLCAVRVWETPTSYAEYSPN
jgi:6-pyruvoyltetrahydropterin/6-carboxytetrahydropterin synthase